MAKLNDINDTKPITIYALKTDLDQASADEIPSLLPISLKEGDVVVFLGWAGDQRWREEFEADLQCVAEDLEGKPLLTTWMPLITFRNTFCASGLTHNEETGALMNRIRAETWSWRDAGCDLVAVEGYRK